MLSNYIVESLNGDEMLLNCPEGNTLDDLKHDMSELKRDSVSVIQLLLSTDHINACNEYYRHNNITSIQLLKEIMDDLSINIKFDWDLPRDYIPIKLHEDWERVYRPFKDDSFAGCINLTQSLFDDYPVSAIDKKSVIRSKLFYSDNRAKGCEATNHYKSPVDVKNESYYIPHSFILKLAKEMNVGLVLAGGAVLHKLFRTNKGDYTEPKDYDYFFYNTTEDMALKFIQQLQTHKDNYFMRVMRSKYAITFDNQIQFILRIYSSVQEILLGFDLDSSRFAYDGENVWTTESGLFSLKNRVNVVNFDKASTTFENRLIKYAHRGFDIFVPKFSYKNVLLENIPELSENVPEKNIYKSKGLSKILFSCLFNTSYDPEKSDYVPVAKSKGLYYIDGRHATFTDPYVCLQGETRFVVFDSTDHIVFVGYFCDSVDKKYMPYDITDGSMVQEATTTLNKALNKDLKSHVPDCVEFITINPGQQSSHSLPSSSQSLPSSSQSLRSCSQSHSLPSYSFKPVVLSDVKSWYNGLLYQCE